MTLFTLSTRPLDVRGQTGFSLIEMAIVLVILGFLLASVMMPLSSQHEVSQRQSTERQLQEISNALIGFAQANGHLPCPSLNGAPPPNDGIALPAPCGAANGVPYRTLGINGTVINGVLVDLWNRPLRYRLTNVSANTWQYATGTIPLNGSPAPDFVVCRTSIGATASACGAGNGSASNVVAVLLSEGVLQYGSSDEIQNRDADPVFVMQTPVAAFDDIVVWIPQSTLIYELGRAGR